jgi:hypothetical protein
LARNQVGIAREASLVLALAEPAQAAEMLKTLSMLPAQQRDTLAQESHELYLSLLNPKAAVSFDTNLRRAEVLFHQRRNDPYFAGGVQYYGGGSDNENVVDFMLAAVLKRVARSSASIHAWRWT